MRPSAGPPHKKSVICKSAHHGTSKRAPVPIPRHTRRHALRDRLAHIWRERSAASTTNHRRRRHALAAIFAAASAATASAAVDAVAPVPAAGARAARDFPAFVLAPTELAGATAVPEGVERGVLVEWDEVGGVRVAEDVPAATTVVTAREVGKGASARGSIADGCIGVGLGYVSFHLDFTFSRERGTNLPVIPRREVSHATERFSAPLAIHEAAESPFPIIGVGAQERGGVEAIVCARGREGSRARLAAWGLRGSQDGGDVEGGFRGAELPRVG